MPFQLETSHRVLRGEVDQKVDIDQLLTSVGVAPVSSTNPFDSFETIDLLITIR